MDAMVEGVKFPPVTVFYDGTDYWLADGFHRVTAAQQADLKEIAADVHQGTREDAQWYSFSANKANGRRRSNEDKQRAVKAALQHAKAAGMSDRLIEKHAGVADVTVGEWRRKLTPLQESCSQNTSERKRLGADGRTINVVNIGKRKPDPSFEGEQVERDQLLRGASPEQVIELRAPGRVQVDDLAVKHSVVLDRRGNALAQPAERLVGVAVARDQLAPATVDVGQRAEAVVLQFEDPVRVIERLG